MPMWKAGTFKRGFTLIELLIVLTILSITLTFIVPRVMGREEAEVRSAARKLLYTVRRLSDEAVYRKEKRVLSIDIENGEYSIDGHGDNFQVFHRVQAVGNKSKLSAGISIKNVVIGKEEISKGPASIAFFPSGFRDEAQIHILGKGMGKGYTVVIPALGERFEIKEK